MASDTESVSASDSHHRRRSSLESGGGTSDRDDSCDDERVEDVYVVEMQRRAREASALEIAANCQNGTVGQLEEQHNIICHICHKRANVVYLFPCGHAKHTYCKYHVEVSVKRFACVLRCCLRRFSNAAMFS